MIHICIRLKAIVEIDVKEAVNPNRVEETTWVKGAVLIDQQVFEWKEVRPNRPNSWTILAESRLVELNR